mmetsp:Transcript_27850/g.75299  ORF Transcript_27850/g.75299 Transcript_27850/m.75299 type:complete len:413 (+) Transcript_27850:1299-2537(+)
MFFIELLQCGIAGKGEGLQAVALGSPKVVHVRLEVAVVAAHDLLFTAQRAVAVLPLPRVCGDLCAPVCERLLQLDQLAHALLNHTRRLGIIAGEVLEGLGAMLCTLQVRPVCLLKMALQLLYNALQLDLEHIVLFTISVLDLFTLGLKVLSKLVVHVSKLLLHRCDDVGHVLALPHMGIYDLRALHFKLLLERFQVLRKISLQRFHALVLQIHEALHHQHVRAYRHAILLLCLLQVSIEHLHDGILPVHFSLMVLTQYLDVAPQFLHLGHAHDLAPLVVYLNTVEVRISVLADTTLSQLHAHHFLLACLLLTRLECLHLQPDSALFLRFILKLVLLFASLSFRHACSSCCSYSLNFEVWTRGPRKARWPLFTSSSTVLHCCRVAVLLCLVLSQVCMVCVDVDEATKKDSQKQ